MIALLPVIAFALAAAYPLRYRIASGLADIISLLADLLEELDREDQE